MTKAEKDNYWMGLIQQCRVSGISDYAWCNQNGIGNHGGKKQGVSFAAGFTDNATDVETEFTFGRFNKTMVVPMNR